MVVGAAHAQQAAGHVAALPQDALRLGRGQVRGRQHAELGLAFSAANGAPPQLSYRSSGWDLASLFAVSSGWDLASLFDVSDIGKLLRGSRQVHRMWWGAAVGAYGAQQRW